MKRSRSLLFCLASILVAVSLVGCAPLPTPAAGNPPPSPTLPSSKFSYDVARESTFVRIQGEPFPLTDDNCDGARDSEQIAERRQAYIVQFSAEIENEIAAELGADIKVAEVMIREQVSLALGIRIGAEVNAMGQIKIQTPPGWRTETQAQWQETWTKGTVAIKRRDGSYVGVVPFVVLNDLTLNKLGSKSVECDTGRAVETPMALAETQPTPNALPKIRPTPAPVYIGSMTVPGNSSEGLRFTAEQAGNYWFTYKAGAYSTYPVEQIGGRDTWLTAVRVFKNRPIVWEGTAISNYPDYNFVDALYSFSAEEAQTKAQGRSAVVQLVKGDVLILVAVDGRPFYSDNPGEVTFDVAFSPLD